MIGDAANRGAIFGGSGSGLVVPKHTVTVLDALRARLNSSSSFSGAAGPGPVTHATGFDTAVATRLAAAADVAIVVIAATSMEGRDRNSLSLNQSGLVALVAAAQPNTIVVAVSPGPFLSPWAAVVRALVDVGLPGEQVGGIGRRRSAGAVRRGAEGNSCPAPLPSG